MGTSGDRRTRANALVASLADRLPAERVEHFRSLSFAGEWAELANSLLAVLQRSEVTLSTAEHQQLREFLYSFELPRHSLPGLAKRDEILARLSVSDG